MEKITKKEFCRLVTNEPTIFMGIIREETSDEDLENAVCGFIRESIELLNHRSAMCCNMGIPAIKFSGGSLLDLRNTKYAKWECFHCGDFWSDYYQTFFPVVCAHETWYDEFEQKQEHKFLYYLLIKKYYEMED